MITSRALSSSAQNSAFEQRLETSLDRDAIGTGYGYVNTATLDGASAGGPKNFGEALKERARRWQEEDQTRHGVEPAPPIPPASGASAGAGRHGRDFLGCEQ